MRGSPQIALSANGNSLWVQHDTYQTPPAITLAGFVSSTAVLTWAVQFTCDDIGPGAPSRSIQVSQTTTVITVTDSGPPLKTTFGAPDAALGHGLSPGDWYKIVGTGVANLDGEYAVVTVPTATTLTLTSLVSQSASGVGFGVGARVFTHSVLTGQTARAVSNYVFPVRASRLVVSGYTSGVAFLEFLQGGMSS